MPPVAYTRYRTQWDGLKYAYSRAWGPRTSVVPAHMKTMGINELAATLQQFSFGLDRAGKRIPFSMNYLAQLLARVDQNYSMRMSAGPVDPREQNPKAAWKIPVRRITGAYYQHWFVRRLAPGVWIVYNPTREAYYIEYGIHTSGRRVRRPVRKLALIKTLKFADRNRVGHLVWEGIFGHLRTPGGTGRGRLIVHQAPQSPRVMGML